MGNQINSEEILQELERPEGFPIAKIARLPDMCGMSMNTHLSSTHRLHTGLESHIGCSIYNRFIVRAACFSSAVEVLPPGQTDSGPAPLRSRAPWGTQSVPGALVWRSAKGNHRLCILQKKWINPERKGDDNTCVQQSNTDRGLQSAILLQQSATECHRPQTE